MRTGPTNPILAETIQALKRDSISHEAPIWKTIATNLENATRQRCVVNLSRINRFSKDGEVIVVPGKVLGSGDLDHKITIAAFAFSGSAKSKIEGAKGKCISFTDIIKNHPDGKNVRILG